MFSGGFPVEGAQLGGGGRGFGGDFERGGDGGGGGAEKGEERGIDRSSGAVEEDDGEIFGAIVFEEGLEGGERGDIIADHPIGEDGSHIGGADVPGLEGGLLAGEIGDDDFGWFTQLGHEGGEFAGGLRDRGDGRLEEGVSERDDGEGNDTPASEATLEGFEGGDGEDGAGEKEVLIHGPLAEEEAGEGEGGGEEEEGINEGSPLDPVGRAFFEEANATDQGAEEEGGTDAEQATGGDGGVHAAEGEAVFGSCLASGVGEGFGEIIGIKIDLADEDTEGESATEEDGEGERVFGLSGEAKGAFVGEGDAGDEEGGEDGEGKPSDLAGEKNRDAEPERGGGGFFLESFSDEINCGSPEDGAELNGIGVKGEEDSGGGQGEEESAEEGEAGREAGFEGGENREGGPESEGGGG